jgi:hypothetical protein
LNHLRISGWGHAPFGEFSPVLFATRTKTSGSFWLGGLESTLTWHSTPVARREELPIHPIKVWAAHSGVTYALNAELSHWALGTQDST